MFRYISINIVYKVRVSAFFFIYLFIEFVILMTEEHPSRWYRYCMWLE